MFKAIHGIALFGSHFDIHGYDTMETGSTNVYFPTDHQGMYRNIFFLYSGGKLWNDLPDFVKNSTNV